MVYVVDWALVISPKNVIEAAFEKEDEKEMEFLSGFPFN